MIRINKTPLDILNDIYSLAYWMTGSEKASDELVNRTYLNADISTRETDLLKVFRSCYIDRYGQDTELGIDENGNGTTKSVLGKLRRRAADVKLSVLLYEISGLKHRQISEIMDRPVETIRHWLFWGRKFLVKDCLLKASA
ncbi:MULTISPECIES: RNA polymerase sigma factor [Prosthecochloris]|uniref:RNA polymerase subunit sigma-24 n=1 Tax=Prosthecochloris marina TaxID=2017681 RepID=A0A317TA57_9CHLB|nr:MULTISPECIES: sigma factor-like helix-turn-helix DNA-binding protein [Prosthecochloris]PWW83370.1 RNA polymerase subunit sigma-24 [Prosthecochloris marina]UZJ36575.1 RNA polymerase subunit sigma-24 [Prosthecochloris sp. SCSIO W1103]